MANEAQIWAAGGHCCSAGEKLPDRRHGLGEGKDDRPVAGLGHRVAVGDVGSILLDKNSHDSPAGELCVPELHSHNGTLRWYHYLDHLAGCLLQHSHAYHLTRADEAQYG